jgi:hypothetical protein
MRYRLRTLLILLAVGPMGVAVYAQKPPSDDAHKGKKPSHYQQLLLLGVHPLEAQIRDDLLYTRLIWNSPKQAFQWLDELEKGLNAIQTDAADAKQAIVRAKSLIHEERTALEVYSTPIEDWAKRVDERPNDAATLNKYVRKVTDLFGFRGNARDNANSAKELAQAQVQLAKWEQQVTDDDVKKQYAAAKAKLARIEKAIARGAENSDAK